ncbi:unnamed protein product [Leptosia nina]|uniref:Protein-L-isoaspartate O-methyltransferase domain-containing protein 1 n=1 Tax=Leptosia nina TaxID=320188 RepID=A0AAV1JT45_9NEOP
MGGAVSSGRDNNELIDNLMTENYIRTRTVEKVFRALDRADYMTPDARDQAYKDLAWRNGLLHLSAPCIYCEVMEGLELTPGLSFLNIGSGTGYLSTLVGLILGSSGISHGVELQPSTVEYAMMKLRQFIECSPILDDLDFCEPKFFTGNGLTLAPLQCGYDRVYCGAGCPEEYESYFKNLIKVGGILVMPINDTLQRVKRVSEDKWVTRSVLNVSFATLHVPRQNEAIDQLKLADLVPPSLQCLARARIRLSMQESLVRRHPELKERPWRRPQARLNCARRICIPIEPADDVQNLLHDLDEESGANEMNALLSLVISMGRNRMAGSVRFDRVARRGSDNNDSSQQDEDNDASSDNDTVDNNPTADEIPASTTNLENDAKGENKTDSQIKKSNEDDKEHSKNLKDEDSDSDSQSDSSASLGGLKAKLQQLTANRDSTHLARIKMLSEKLTRDIGIASTSNFEGENGRERNDPKMQVISVLGDDSSEDSDENDYDNENGLYGIPSEVIFTAKSEMEEPGTSAAKDDKPLEKSCNTNVRESKPKRQKLDSGIGENTPTEEEKSGESQGSGSDDNSNSWMDIEPEFSPLPGDRRRRSDALRSTDDMWPPSYEEMMPFHEEQRQTVRMRRNRDDIRWARLSVAMKQSINELPLPHSLRKFVNLGRCYEFE